jgi:hypothetical protein
VITSTFQIAPGLGPRAEHRLWDAGVTQWSDYCSGRGFGKLRTSQRTDAALRVAIDDATCALASGNVDGLAARLPSREHWRLFSAFGAGAAYLDIETSDDTVGFAGISAIGVLDRSGPRFLLAGRDLHRFPEVALGWSMLVTFNGLSFDVPILRRAFPEWQPPVCHIAGLDGSDTGWLFRRAREGDRDALRRFAEYNLYDAINLRTLMAYAYNALLDAQTARAPRVRAGTGAVPVPGRGDVLYDVSKILLTL